MVEALAKLEAGALALAPQAAEGVTYARKIDKAETRIDWRRPAETVHNHIRALSPSPGAWCEIAIAGKAERLKVLRSVAVDWRGDRRNAARRRTDDRLRRGAVRLLEVQRAGGKPLTARNSCAAPSSPKGASPAVIVAIMSAGSAIADAALSPRHRI